MNCETIDSILDDHLVARLTPAERQQAAEHVDRCARCSAAWTADDALRGDAIADAPPELFAALARRVAAAPVRREAAARSRWLWPAAAVAAVAIVGIGVRFGVVEPVAGTMNAVSAGALDAISSAPSPTSAASPFVAGRDYEVLPGAAARPAVAASGQIEVTEFFMFRCFPCYAFQPDLDRWQALAPSDVSLTRVPALFNEAAQLQARAYYTAEVLGLRDAMHNAFYDEIHERGNALASRAAVADFFERFGVDSATFDAAFDSAEVDARMQRAAALNRAYGITATPILIVAGRYATRPGLADPETPIDDVWRQMLAVVDQLVAERRACRDRCDEAARAR
jgi:protein dithiol oxidoreductase (disulfide-forming)